MLKEQYIAWLISWIQSGVINIKTGKPITVDDIINLEYKTEVEARLAA